LAQAASIFVIWDDLTMVLHLRVVLTQR